MNHAQNARTCTHAQDYLRRSGLRGFFLPLSGGIDSSSTATIVGNMCNMIVAAAADGDEGVIADVRRVAREDPDGDYVPTDPRELANRIFYTVRVCVACVCDECVCVCV